MSLSVLELPDSPAEMAAWLDRQLVGLDLGTLAADLAVVHAKTAGNPEPTVEGVLGDRLAAVLRGGLRHGTRSGLSMLLRHPRLLVDLQERIVAEGGSYWSDLAREDGGTAALAAATLPEVATTGLKTLSGPAPARGRRRQSTDAATTTAEEPQARSPRPPRVGLLRFWARTATVAASAFLFLYVVENRDRILDQVDPDGRLLARLYPEGMAPRRPGPLPPVIKPVGEPPWGWSRTALYADDREPGAYLDDLAEAAGEWFDEVPFSKEALAKRLGGLRSGLSQLFLAAHAPLPEEDREWLREQARAFADVLDEAVRAVEEGASVDEVRQNMDDAVALMIRGLIDRAASHK